MPVQTIQKRDGRVVNFAIDKIAHAIFKSQEAVGMPDFVLAQSLGAKVQAKLSEIFREEEIPKVEQVQDIVEQVLVENGQARVAKAYILYRQKRTEVRKQKQQILQKEEIDEVDKRFDLNALRVLCSRYLKKNDQGEIIESPRQLFERVAVHTFLPTIFFNSAIFQKETGAIFAFEEFNHKEMVGQLKIGRFILNEFHLEALKRLYDRFNKQGQMKISFSELLAKIERGDFVEGEKEIWSYFQLMAERKFFPNTPALVNFGNYLGMGSACFALGVEDSIESIMEALWKAAIIFKSGGGVGYNFSKLRPEGDFVKSTGGISSGPLSFMSLFDKMTDVIKQGGVRRGASMGILDIDHPDIEKFIVAKRGNGALRNFNLSVFVKKDFWEYYENKKPYPLRNPKNGEPVKFVDPQNLFDLIVYQAWESAEPGLIFEDTINDHNPFFKTLGPIKCTNPCGEIPLYEKESCNLGSINIWSFCKSKPGNGKAKEVFFDWQDFQRTIEIATRFLDNVVDVNKYPLLDIEEATLNTRKIGLGLMGLADVLFELGLPYNSAEGLDFMAKLMEFLNFHSKKVSCELARERGVFPYFEKSFFVEGKLPFRGSSQGEGELPFGSKFGNLNLDWEGLKEEIKKYGLRNGQTTTNAPTGSISMIAGVSSGIEPNFSLVFEKKVTIGSFYYVNPVFEKVMSREGLFDEDLIKEVCERSGSLQGLSYIPYHLKRIFVTAMDIKAEDHIRALATLQAWTDSSISKTINFPSFATVQEMKEAFLLGYQLGCKDLTVFRDKSIVGVLSAGARSDKEKEKKDKSEGELVSMKDEKSQGGPVIYHDLSASQAPPMKDFNGNSSSNCNNVSVDMCPKCQVALVRQDGCKKCPSCGYGICGG